MEINIPLITQTNMMPVGAVNPDHISLYVGEDSGNKPKDERPRFCLTGFKIAGTDLSKNMVLYPLSDKPEKFAGKMLALNIAHDYTAMFVIQTIVLNDKELKTLRDAIQKLVNPNTDGEKTVELTFHKDQESINGQKKQIIVDSTYKFKLKNTSASAKNKNDHVSLDVRLLDGSRNDGPRKCTLHFSEMFFMEDSKGSFVENYPQEKVQVLYENTMALA
ncbi:hypothetical protein [Francisella frigiditurris]|uniref:Uncharacterized protein n=1 Tax=Francisella frigiditurris TaxID=1542390 RepID=A0A1J0KSM1_9GAMM|nr:hypothetical protein [Francisella frigiditurris]APC96753.1 hypothetical protein KX01_1294 [Francisella frigiditurris]